MPVMDIEQALQRRQFMTDVVSRLMKKDVDFGKIQGTDRDVLLQPGADKLCNIFGLVITYTEVISEADWTGERHGGEPFFYYKVAGRAYRGDVLMGEGIGSCNSWESKYRWRKAERTCPGCGKENIRKSRNPGEGWYCWAKTGGCGATFLEGDPKIENQQVGRKPNPDVADMDNTILKMAYKRCKMSTTINATSASEFFTQDVEDFTPPEEIPVNTGPYAPGTREAAAFVAGQKIQAGDPSCASPWRSMRDMAAMFEAIREKVGEVVFRTELERYGWKSFKDLRNALDAAAKNPDARKRIGQQAIECYTHLTMKGVA